MNSQRHKLVMPQARNLIRRLFQKVIFPLTETRLKRQQLMLVFNIDLSIRNTMRRDILESSQHVWRKGNHLRAYSQDIRQRVEDDAIKAYSAKGKYFRFSIFPFRRTRIPSVVLRWLCKCSSYFIYSFFVISFRFCRILAEAVSISIHSGWERRRQCQMFHIDEYSGQFTKSQLHAHECSADSANRQFIHDDWNKSGATEIKDDVSTAGIRNLGNSMNDEGAEHSAATKHPPFASLGRWKSAQSYCELSGVTKWALLFRKTMESQCRQDLPSESYQNKYRKMERRK